MRVNALKKIRRVLGSQREPVRARYQGDGQRVVVKTSRMEGWLMGQFTKGLMLVGAFIGGVILIGKLLSPIFNKVIDFLYELKKGFQQA